MGAEGGTGGQETGVQSNLHWQSLAPSLAPGEAEGDDGAVPDPMAPGAGTRSQGGSRAPSVSAKPLRSEQGVRTSPLTCDEKPPWQ